MALTWKDLVTTILAILVFGLYYAMSKGINLPIISSYRGAILILGIIGITMCAFSGGSAGVTGPFITIASILGVAALILIIYGLIAGTKIAFLLLTITLIVLWAVATFRHLIGV